MSDWRADQVAFYSSPAWKNLRDAVLKERGRLCEMCLKKGIYRAATMVHHIVPLTAENVRNPQISLNADNCMALCRDCHAAIHSNRRYKVDENGNVTIL